VDFRILGPLEVCAEGELLAIAPGHRRAVLIDLVLHANEVVADARLIDDLWGEQPPPTAQKILQLHVSNLRRAIGSDRIVRTSPGYVLQTRPGETDTDRVRVAVDQAAAAEPARRVELLRAALSEWRGRPLIDVEYHAFARGEVDRLEELRSTILEQLYDAELELGHHAKVVGDLEALVVEQPHRERARALLMLALYRTGRHTDALDRYRTGRALLARELGLEPGPELQRLERQILEHDPSLGPPPAAERPGPRRRRRQIALPMTAAGVAAAIIGGFLLAGRSVTVHATANAVLGVNQTGRFVRSLPAGAVPDTVAVTSRQLWVGNFSDSTVTRIDLRNSRATTVGTSAAPTSIVLDAGSAWIASRFAPTILRLDATTAQVDGTVKLRFPADGIAYGVGALWAVNEAAGTLTRIDPKTLSATVVRRELAGPSAVAVANGGVWIAASFSKRLLRYDPRAGTITSLPLSLTPEQLAVGCGAIWLTNPADNEITRIDERSLQPQLIAVGTDPTALSVADGHAWVINDLSHSANEIDCGTTAVVKTLVFGTNAPRTAKLTPKGVSMASDGTAWIALQSF
jgi:DNA-binding SARP family transcriptional activator/streptogramin lyase